MRLLLDTHFLIWLARDPETITAKEQAALTRAQGRLVASSISIWELRIKWNTRRDASRAGLVEPAEAIRFARAQGIDLADLTAEDCAATLDPPIDHRDPFDEMLLIHAQRLGARLLTRDRALAGHPLAWLVG